MSDQVQLGADGTSIAVSPDGMQAILQIGQAADPEAISVDALRTQAEELGLAVGIETVRLIEQGIAKFRAEREDAQFVIAHGIPPKRGANGRIEWQPGLEFDEDEPEHPEGDGTAQPPEPQSTDHYQKNTFLTVDRGQHLATLYPPEPGESGFDVYGQRIPPKAGAPYNLKAHHSIRITDGGEVIAAISGLLTRSDHHLRIDSILQIENVDFSTGHVDFDGEVIISGGVCDRFYVEATGDLTIRGLIEAAHIYCGGELTANGGMAGRDVGTLVAACDAKVRYLVGVRGAFDGDLTVDKEIINSRIDVAGNLELRKGDMIGSDVTVQRHAKVNTLGSEAGVATTLRLGYVPDVSEALTAIAPLLPRMVKHLDELRKQLDEINTRPDRDDEATQKRRLELQGGIQQLEAKHATLQRRFETLLVRFEHQSLVDLEVYDAIHPGVKLVMPKCTLEFIETMPGPLVLRRSDDGKIHLGSTNGVDIAVESVARPYRTKVW